MQRIFKIFFGSLFLSSFAFMRMQKGVAAADEQPQGSNANIGSLNAPKMYFRYGAKNIPHIEKRQKGGEDAWVA